MAVTVQSQSEPCSARNWSPAGGLMLRASLVRAMRPILSVYIVV